jgi:hypothetical protein
MSNPVTATVQVDARPEVVYELITDLPTLTSLAEETVAMESRKGDAISKGTVFVGHNENRGAGPRSAPSPTPNRVVSSHSMCGTRCFR